MKAKNLLAILSGRRGPYDICGAGWHRFGKPCELPARGDHAARHRAHLRGTCKCEAEGAEEGAQLSLLRLVVSPQIASALSGVILERRVLPDGRHRILAAIPG